MSLRVALNAAPLLSPATGVGQYICGLAGELLQLADVECEFFYAHYWTRELRAAPATLLGSSEVRAAVKRWIPRSHEFARFMQHMHFVHGAYRKGCTLYHEPNFFPYRSGLRTVTTIHDLSPIRFPDTHTEQSRRIWRKLLPAALRRSQLILTDSEYIRGEITALLGVPPERVRAIHLGVSAIYRELPPKELSAHLAVLGLEPRRYVLAVGTLEPRKNLIATLDAYHRLPDSMAREHPLVIAGLKGWLTETLQRRLAGLEAQGKVRVLGYVSQEALVALYGGARLLVYPSLYEGFGLPPLEAMACGTPVIVSNRASLPEVVGEAGTQVEAHDVAAIAEAMARLLEDEGHWRRQRAAGLARAKQFTWRRCAEATLEAYRAAAA